MPTIYLHPNCPTYTLSPLLMLSHLHASHAATTARTIASHGRRGLNAHLLKHTLHQTPHAHSTPVFPCADCSVLFYTAIDAHMHLLAPQHADEVAHVRESRGEEGVAGMLCSAWLVVADVLDPAQVDVPARMRADAGPVCVSLTVERYTKREHYPARVKMAVSVPRGTATVAALAACVEGAWVAKGGAGGKVDWGRMVNAVGMQVDGGGEVVTDEDVRAWVVRAEGEQVARMSGRANGG